jgi:hypothetical protein
VQASLAALKPGDVGEIASAFYVIKTFGGVYKDAHQYLSYGVGVPELLHDKAEHTYQDYANQYADGQYLP